MEALEEVKGSPGGFSFCPLCHYHRRSCVKVVTLFSSLYHAQSDVSLLSYSLDWVCRSPNFLQVNVLCFYTLEQKHIIQSRLIYSFMFVHSEIAAPWS